MSGMHTPAASHPRSQGCSSRFANTPALICVALRHLRPCLPRWAGIDRVPAVPGGRWRRRSRRRRAPSSAHRARRAPAAPAGSLRFQGFPMLWGVDQRGQTRRLYLFLRSTCIAERMFGRTHNSPSVYRNVSVGGLTAYLTHRRLRDSSCSAVMIMRAPLTQV